MTKEHEDKLNILVKALQGVMSLYPPQPEAPATVEEVEVIKQFNPDKMEIIEPLYMAGGEVDAHRHAYKDPIEGPKNLVKALKEGLDKKTVQFSLFHDHATKGFEITEVWVNEKEAKLTDGTIVPANLPLGLVKFHNEKLYNLRVNKQLKGLSMGARGLGEFVSKEDGDSFYASISKTPEDAVYLIHDFAFLHKAAHYAYTSADQGGAASKLNDYVTLMKKSNLTENENKILEEIGEEYTELEKAKLAATEACVDKEESNTQPQSATDVDNQTLIKEHPMPDVTEAPEYKALLKQVNELTTKDAISHLDLDKAIVSPTISALAELNSEARDTLIKAMDSIKEEGKTALEALKAEHEVALNKAVTEVAATAAAPVEDNELLKSLSNPVGHDTAPEAPQKPLTIAQAAAKAYQESKGAK